MDINYEDVVFLENSLKNRDLFITNLNSLFLNKGMDYTLGVLKATGVSIDAYNSHRYKSLAEQSINLLKEKAKDLNSINQLDKFIYQSLLLNKLFMDFYNKPQFKVTKGIPKNVEVYAFFIGLEVILRNMNDIIFNGSRNKEKYLLDITFRRNFGNINKSLVEMTAEEMTNFIEFYLQSSVTVVSYLMFYHKSESLISIDQEINIEHIRASIDHSILIDIRKVLFDLYELWRFHDFDAKVENSNLIRFSPKIIQSLLNERISINRFENGRLVDLLEGVYGEYSKINRNTSMLAPDEFLDKEEKIDYMSYESYFYSNSLDDICNGVPMKEWLRAYAIVRNVSKEFLKKEMFPTVNAVSKWCIIMSKNDWISKFISYGISPVNTPKILNNLILDDKSVDLLDCPLIEIDSNIFLLPSIGKAIQGNVCLLSLFARKNYIVKSRGSHFEQRVLNQFIDAGIKAGELYGKDDQEEQYQCDLAFILDKDLYICECKSYLQPRTSRGFLELKSKELEAITQLKRISEFFLNNLQIVNEVLGMPVNWKPRQIINLLIVAPKVGDIKQIMGTYIVDSTIISSILGKRLPTLVNGEERIQFVLNKYKYIFEGRLTSNKFMNFIKNPYQIDFQRYNIKIMERTVPIEHLCLKELYLKNRQDTFSKTEK